MDLFFPDYPNKKFHLKLFTNATKDKLKDLYNQDNTLILNADYVINNNLIIIRLKFQILNITHIQIAINRALYNYNVLKKFKSEVIKREILYFLSERSNINLCFELHKLEEKAHDYYILFCF